jgi:hypothetical protein
LFATLRQPDTPFQASGSSPGDMRRHPDKINLTIKKALLSAVLFQELWDKCINPYPCSYDSLNRFSALCCINMDLSLGERSMRSWLATSSDDYR